MADLYENIAKLCRNRGITGGRLCTELGFSRSTLSDLKAGRINSLSSQKLQKIADYLEVTTDSLLCNELDSSRMTDIQYALYHETADVSEETLSRILEFARFAKEQEKKRR